MATSGSSNDKRNFQCVTVASVDVIKLPLRDILASRIQPKDLFPKIQLSSTLKLRPDQKKICFIPPPGVPDYNKFDVTLLYTLIRNLCSLPCPAQGWGNEPRTTDTQISDDIERLRLFRNNYYAHAESAVISDAVFKDVWRDLKLVFRRIQPKKGCSVDYEEELRNIERTTFTDEYFSTFRVLLEALVTLEKQTDDRDEPTVSIQGENEKMWGDTAHFEADVKKAESSCWSITWHRRRGDDIKCIDTSVEKYSGSTKRKLVINSVCKEDEGEYQALLSFESKGIHYKSRNVIRLNVIGDVPSVRIFVDSPVCFGSETIIKSVVSSTPTPEKTEWQKSKDGTVFHLIGKPNIYFGSNENFKNPFLVIPKTTFADKLFYRLVVWNRVGISASNTFFLNVTGSPPNITTSFVTNIKNKSVKLMGEVYFLENSPGILKTFWTKNGEKINIKESGGKLSELITDNPSLTITDVGPDDAGEYKITAVNAVGSTTSEVIVLGIPSVFSERVEDVKNGGRRITVTITSFPAPCQIRWNAKSKDDDTFTPIDINAEEYDGTTVTFPHPMLVVRQRDQLENNCYQIEVTNFIGKIVQTISGNNKPTVRKKDIVQNTFYKDRGARVRFTKLSNILAREFPPQKLENLKFTLTNSNIVQNRTSVMEATSALQCIRILQDEELFTQTDVIVMQFLCTQTECLDLHAKCVEYAEQQKALCYFEKPPVNGYKNAQFHVKGELSSYTKDYIQDVLETVAAILDCKEEDILLNGVRHSNSFLLSLSVKEVYMKKLLALNEQDRLRLVRLNIDYLIIDKETIYLERPKAAYLGPRTMQSFKERNLSTGVLRNQVYPNHVALNRRRSAHARCVYKCTCAYDRWYPMTNITSSGGARPKKSSHGYPSSVDRSVLPDELQNNFYPDVLLIYSQKDEKLAQSFLTETRNKIKDHNYIVASYLDKQVWVNPADGLPDYKRCSAFMYLFTGKKSVKDYFEVTKHGHLADLLYEEKFIPVLSEPEGDLDLSMPAFVSCPLRYYKQQTSDWVPAIKEFLKKHANIRKEKEREHKKKEQVFLDSIETDTPLTPTNKQPIILRTKFANIGDSGNIIKNKYTRDEKVPFMSQQYQNEFHGNPLKKGESLGSPEDVDKLGPPSRDSRGSSQTPWHLPVSFKGKHNSYQSFQNRLSTQVEDFSRRREATLNDRPLSGSLNDVASIEMKQFSPTCNNRPVAREIPTEASFPVLPSISSMASLKPSNSDVYKICGAPIKCENRPSPIEVCCTMCSFSNIPDLYGPPSETNIPIPNPQKRHTHEECVENIYSIT